MQIIQIKSRDEWNSRVSSPPTAHILQSWEWGEFKARTTGWTPERLCFMREDGKLLAAASLLTRRIGPLQVIYIPRGPIFAELTPTIVEPVLDHLQKLARQRGAIWLKIDPDITAATGLPAEATTASEQPEQLNLAGQRVLSLLHSRKWRFSSDQVQFRNTLTLDLTKSEDELLANMSQSTRRKIRQADKQGVTVRAAQSENDLRALYDIYATTGSRQGFIVRPWSYYFDLWESFRTANLAHILMAEHAGQTLAGVVLFHFAQRVWYFYGMSSNDQRDLQPNYALQWAAIRWAKSQGYQLYDWWGAPNEFVEADSMWGVYRFKLGFGSQIVRTLGAWDYIAYPPLYWFYMQVIPRLIRWRRGKGTQSHEQ